MSTLKANNIQIGQSATASQNFVLAVPATPDGTIKLARGNAGATTQDVLTIDATGKVIFPAGGGGGLSSVSTVSVDTSANSGTLYFLMAGITLTLPASPSTGDIVGVARRTNSTIIIARNGHNIMGLSEDMTVDIANTTFSLLYTDATNGWVII